MTRKIIYSLLSTLLVIFMITACGDEERSSTENTTDENSAANAQFDNTGTEDAQFENTGADDTNPLEGNNPMQVVDENGEVVFHYVCPNGCEGSGGPGQAPCPVCGASYEHNAKFHQYQQQGGGTQSTNNPINIQNQQTQTPGANADGVYHFICPKGCEGGSGSRGICSSCGTELAHNDAFHN